MECSLPLKNAGSRAYSDLGVWFENTTFFVEIFEKEPNYKCL